MEQIPGTIDVSQKEPTLRRTTAVSVLAAASEVIAAIRTDSLPKKGPLETARAAGMLAVKRTPTLIPHCHPIAVTGITLDFEFSESAVRVLCSVTARDRTGPEIEALFGAMTAALTLYDMIKGIYEGARIEQTFLLEKEGGKSGTWRATVA